MEEGCKIEISGGREEGVRQRGGGGEGCSISGCSDKAENSGTSWEFCVPLMSVCSVCSVVLPCGLLLKRSPTMDDSRPLCAFVLYGG